MVHMTRNDALYMYWGVELNAALMHVPVHKSDEKSDVIVKCEMLRSRAVERTNKIGSSFGEQLKFYYGQRGDDGNRDQK